MRAPVVVLQINFVCIATGFWYGKYILHEVFTDSRVPRYF